MDKDLTPPEAELEHRILGWCSSALEEGEAFLKSQKGYSKISETIDSIMGEDQSVRSSSLSSTSCNQLGHIALNLSAAMTDVRPFWEYKTFNKKYEPQQVALGKLSLHLWLQRRLNMRYADTVRYWVAAGTGFMHPHFNPVTGDLDASAEDPRDILPIRPSNYTSIQDAVGVIIRRERSVNYLKSHYPEKAHLIKADRDGSLAKLSTSTRAGRLLQSINAFSPFQEYLFGRRPVAELKGIPVADEYILYCRSDEIHRGSTPIIVGDPDTNWSYTVNPGEKKYPRGRRITFTRAAVLSDGPNQYWHGLFPLCKLTLDPWPWTWLGKAPLWDLLPLQKALDRNIRVIDDHNEKVARPDLIADKNAVSRAALDRIDTRKGGLKMTQNPLGGKGIQVVQTPPLDQSYKDYIAFLIDRMETLSGTKDLSALSKLGQVPSSETVEKILESQTPSIRLRSQAGEAFMAEFAMIQASNICQFLTLPQRLAVLGPDGLTFEDFDYDPNMIPSFVHKEDFNDMGDVTPEALMRGPRPRYDRAREFLRQFTFHIAPGSLLASSEITRKLLYIQLARGGYVDRWSLLEVLGIPNVGDPPPGANTITKRLMAEQEMFVQNVSPTGRKATAQVPPRMTPSGIVESP
jgi:hypothetical protein